MAATLQIISGVLTLNSDVKIGHAEVDFVTGAVTGNATADPAQPIRGHGCRFRDIPHVLVSPTDLRLSTHDNTFFMINRSVTPGTLRVNWRIDHTTSGIPKAVKLQIDFLVIGEPRLG
jgi:hypothetical protein